MLITIDGLLGEEGRADMSALVETLAWKDGAKTAGRTARQVKHNQQADLSSRTGAKLREQITAALLAHPVFQAAAQPRRLSHLIVSKTGSGGGYGLHVDNAFMGAGEARLRTDLSFTLFLTDPAQYSGGELAIEHAGYRQSVKLEAGSLVLYPSTHLHEVRPVTEGERIVCVGWIESHVPDAGAREILFDLENLRASLAATHGAQSPERLILAKTISNLLRRFSAG
ncbi:MAG: Fe2+-dependent dioxygenase [Pseudomonadota bacterium]